MPALLTEGLVDRLKAFVEDNIDAKLAAVSADYPDSIALTKPVVSVGERRLMDGQNYPAIFIYGTSMQVERFEATWTDATHGIALEVVCRSMDTGELWRERARFVRAVWELMVERFFQTTGDDYFPVGTPFLEVEYERVDALETGGPYVGRATLEMRFNKQENVH